MCNVNYMLKYVQYNQYCYTDCIEPLNYIIIKIYKKSCLKNILRYLLFITNSFIIIIEQIERFNAIVLTS